ncbi:MAG: DUF6493 family protein [Rubripirellula sp.]|nr:DUF6493 family protein [Rubripirellula sp.]
MAKRKPASTKKTTASTRQAKQDACQQTLCDKLQTLLEKSDTETKIIKLLLALDESERRKLFPVCQKNYRVTHADQWTEDPPGTFRQNQLLSPAKVAVFCTANFTELKKLGRWSAPQPQYVLQILEHRKPKWCGSYVEQLIEQGQFWSHWKLCRELVRRGLCKKPDHPRYYTGMITGLVGRWSRGKTDALRELRKDPALLKDEIWRLFEHEGEGDNTLANVDRWEASNWSGALVTLAQEGKLSRGKLLDASLTALELGFNHYRARWFFNFFDRLEPTNPELRKRSTQILELMDSPTPNVAQWAFEHQHRMFKAGLINDTSKIITASAPLLGGRHKKTVTQVLKLFDALATKSPQFAHEICLTTTEALSHEKPDVQRSAFKLIQKHGSPNEPSLREQIEKYEAVVSATVAQQMKAWLGVNADEQETEANAIAKQQAASSLPIKASDIGKFDVKDAERLRLPILLGSLSTTTTSIHSTPDVAGITGVTDFAGITGIPANLFDGTEIPRLDPQRKLKPIGGFDELIETLGRVIENDNLIDDAERAVDGLVRYHTEKPADFDKRIGPIFKRAVKLSQKKAAPFSGQNTTGDICGLIIAWTRGEPVTSEIILNEWNHERRHIHGLFDEPFEALMQTANPMMFLSQRMLDICNILVTNQVTQLLSAPTHEGGWIDANLLVERINHLKISPPETDVILAMLRVAPDGRGTAIKKLKPKLKGEWINALKHGLGADRIRIGESAALWAAAARCRAPRQDDTRVRQAFSKLDLEVGKVAKFDVSFKNEPRYRAVTGLPLMAPVNFPTQMLYYNFDPASSLSHHDIGTTAGSIHWLASMWPADREIFFAAGINCIGSNLDWWEAAWHNRCFLEPLLDHDTPLLEMGKTLLLCGLAAKEPGEYGLAVDIAIQAITDGRLGTDNLKEMLEVGFGSGHFNLQRLAKRLDDIATTSELHAYVIMLSTESALPTVNTNKLPRGLGDVFEMLSEIGTRIGRAIEQPSSRSLLTGIKGSGKAAKAAKQLQKLEFEYNPHRCIAAAVENRFERLKEWSARK